MTETGYKEAAGLFNQGLLVAGTLTSVQSIWAEPPLMISYKQIDGVTERLNDVVRSNA